ncbi:hypothetical protein [Turicibacter sanguinis]|uniref:hypothetical protein n=1 Tax=Turicibacter sanguinis TaxID=154288 RepID=UPI002E1F9B49
MQLTHHLVEGSELLGVKSLDHLIIRGGFSMFKSRGASIMSHKLTVCIPEILE